MQMTEAFLAVFETEPWNSSPTASSAPGDAWGLVREAFVVSANALYLLISTIEASWLASVASGKIPNLETEDRDFGEAYRRWLEVCDKTIADLSAAAPGGFQGEGVDELLQNIAEVRCLLESREIEGSMRPIDEILPLARGNPRPERYGL